MVVVTSFTNCIRHVIAQVSSEGLVCCGQEWRLVVFRFVENDVDVIVPVNLHQMHYRIYLRVGASARLTLEFLVFPVVIEVFLSYIGLPSNHMMEVTGRLLWFSAPANVFLL